MDDNKQCRNCGYPISSQVKYCPQCSQKNTDGKVPVWEFLQDFFSNLFNIDSKLFLTFFAVFVPGKLTVEYFKGKHKSYASPVQLFLFAGVTLFAVVIAKTQDIDIGGGRDYYSVRAERVRTKKIIKENIKRFRTSFQDTTSYYQSDSLSHWINNDLGGISEKDSIQFGKLHGRSKVRKVATQDFSNLSADSILSKYNVTDRLEAIMVSQQIKVMKNGRGLFHYYISKLPVMIFFMMPFLALILKLLYVRHSFFFVEHLVFSFHYHTFAFLVTLVLVLIGKYIHGLLVAAFILSVFIYLFIAMRRVYKQCFLKTFAKFCILNFSYLFLVVFFFAFSVVISFLLF